MRVCILVGGRRLLQDPLLEAVEAVRAAGGHVTTITWLPVIPAIVKATEANVELRAVDAQRRAKPPRSGMRSGIRPVDRVLRRAHKRSERVRGGLLRRSERVRGGLLRRWDKLRRKVKLDGQAALVHQLVSRDSRCRSLLAEADVLVAGDPTSIRSIWFLVQRRPEIEAISGLAALRTYLSTHGAKTFSD